MDQARRELIIAALKRKGVKLPCPRCGRGRFDLVDESAISIQNQPGSFVVGGPVVPCIIIACSNCGFITQHATGPLDISPSETKHE